MYWERTLLRRDILRRIALALGLLASISHAADYELLYFAGGPIRSPNEILNETGTKLEQLTAFHCEDEKRFNIFNDTTTPNPNNDSLKIEGSDKKIYTYINGRVIGPKKTMKRKRIRDKFVKAVKAALDKISKVQMGKELINRLQSAYAPFYIQFGRNQYNPAHLNERTNMHGNDSIFVMALDELRPMVERMPFSQIGFTGRINWNHNLKVKLMESDYIEREADPSLALAHEMLHAYDGMRGLLDRRMVWGENFENTTIAEYRAVRFENLMRKEFGQKYRRFYSASDNLSKDMLDDNDEPIVMPTPCIRWL